MRAAFSTLLATAAALAAASPAFALGDDPLPRFEDAVCPGVSGLKVETAELIVGRIRQNAQAIGRTLAPPKTCAPNLIVSFVDNGQAVIESIYRNYGYGFADMSGPERDQVLHQPGPARVFSQVFTRNRDGIPVSRRESLVNPPRTTEWMAHSKIYRGTQENIVHVLVLFDSGAVRGLSVDQIADYATVRAFVHNPPSAAVTRGDSILDLFNASAAARPAGLTTYDHALLDSLYEGMPNIDGTARAATIAKATGRGRGTE